MGFIAMILGLLSQAKEHRKLRKQDALRRKYKREQQQMDEDYKNMRAEMSVEERAEADEQNEKDKKERKAAFDRRLKKEGNPNPVQGFFTTIIGGIVSAINAIQITTIVIQIVAIILVLAIIVSIIASVVSMMANLFIDATVTEASTLGFQNRFDQIKISRTTADNDGAYHMLIQKVDTGSGSATASVVTGGTTVATQTGGRGGVIGNSNNNNNVPYVPKTEKYEYADDDIIIRNVTDDVDLWANMTDTEINQIVAKAIPEDKKTINNVVYMTNVFKAIRMAYRLCYAENENNERYIKGLEPYTLLGIMAIEKGYGWMSANTRQKFQQYAASAMPEETGWLYYDGASWVQNISNLGNVELTNVDNCISTLFIPEYNNQGEYGANCYDGPFSWSICYPYPKYGVEHMIDKFKDVCAKDKKYYAYYNKIASIENYNIIKTFYDPETGLENDPNDYMVAMLLPSMLLTAISFDNSFYDGSYGKSNLNRESTLFGKRYLDIRESQVYNRMDKEADEGDTIGYVLAKALTYSDKSEVSKNERTAWVKQLANTLYYSNHHAVNFAKVMYPCAFIEDSDAGITVRDYSLYGTEVTEDDWYFGQLLLHAMALSLAEGNIMNIDNTVLTNSYGSNGTFWLPLGCEDAPFTCGYTRFGYGGEWFNGKDWKSTEAHGLDWLKELIAAETFDDKYYVSHYLKVGDFKLDTSVWNYVLEKHGGALATALDPKLLDDAFKPLAFSAAGGEYYNMHAFHIEGLCACTIGSDLIEQCTRGVLEVEAEAGGGSGGGDNPEPEDPTVQYTVTFESNGGTAVPSQTVNKNGKAKEPTKPTKDDLKFGGWYSDINMTAKFNFNSRITRDITLYAKWVEKKQETDIDLPSDDTAPYGEYEYWLYPGEFFKDADVTKSVSNIFFPLVDYTVGDDNMGMLPTYNKKSGFVVARNGYGTYAGGGGHHGIDFGIDGYRETADADDWNYLDPNSFFNPTVGAYISALRNNERDVSDPAQLLEDFISFYTDNYGEDRNYYERAPVVAMIDGYVARCTGGYMGTTALGGLGCGNSITLVGILCLYDENGQAYAKNTCYNYYHLCADAPFIWLHYWASMENRDFSKVKLLPTTQTNINTSFYYNASIENCLSGKQYKVKAGQLLGYVGNTGTSDGSHLHLGDDQVTSGCITGTNGSMAADFWYYACGADTGMATVMTDAYNNHAFTSAFQASKKYEFYLGQTKPYLAARIPNTNF